MSKYFLDKGSVSITPLPQGWYELEDITFQTKVRFTVEDIPHIKDFYRESPYTVLVRDTSGLIEIRNPYTNEAVLLDRVEWEDLILYLS